MLPPHKHELKQNRTLYSDIPAGREEKKFTLTLRTKDNHTLEEIIRVLKQKVNPAELQVGITSLKTMRDRILIEASSKTDKHTGGQDTGRVRRKHSSEHADVKKT